MPEPARGALEVVYRETAPYLIQLLRRAFRGAAADVVDDVVAAVFLKLVRQGVPGGEDIRTPLAWLTRTAINAMKDIMRDAARAEDLGQYARAPNGSAQNFRQSETGLPPDVEECLEHLTARERAVVQLKYAGFSAKEIAEMIETTPGAADVTFDKAKKKLRLCLGSPT
jgi:RNA polymerase sigma factor (sigma-70 family)